jgi:septal ring factor EnvC (AmiA/AmiB activator)
MRVMIQTIGILFMISIIMVYVLSAAPVEASFFSRVQDIYNAPDKISEMEQQYNEANEELSRQLEQSRQATEELARKQEQLQAQNADLQEQNRQLTEQNAVLQSEAEQAQQKKEAFQHKMYMSIGVIAGLLAAYFLAIRIWRYLSWRRHKPFHGEGISG